MLKRIIILTIAISLLMSFTALAKTKAVTYFGNEWPVNFLSCEHAQAEEDFARIKADGFNSLIYCVPWREIQPGADGGFNEAAIAKLDQMMSRAEAAGLGVYVRLGYTWDCGSGMDINTRYSGVFRDSGIRNNWINYASRMYQMLSAHSNYQGGFITWEDFWPFLYDMCGTYEEMDEKLIQLLSDTQSVYPNLSMECRLHNDYYKGSWHNHDATFGCANAPYSSAMLAVSMGWPNNTAIETGDAINMSVQMINRMRAAGKPVFIDQFLYTESTPGYESLAKPADTNAYLAEMGNVFGQYTNGYGLWTYKDYADNIVYNPEFGQGEANWILNNASIDTSTGNSRVGIEAGGSISQNLSGRAFSSSEKTKVRLKVESETSGRLTVRVGNKTENASFTPGVQYVDITYPTQCKDKLKITSSAKAYIDDVKVYAHVTTGEIYKLDGTQGAFIAGVRALNSSF